jgi:glucose-1-phosphatase
VDLRAVICDLGGVVIRIDPNRIRDRWAARSSLARAEVHSAFPDDAYVAFERDALTEQEYLAHVRQQLELDASDQELAEDFNQLYLGVDTGTLRTLEGLRNRGWRVIALTNTNRIHEPVWSRRFAAELEVFERIHCSHDLRARKPEPEAFRAVLEHHRLRPDQTLFVDDLADNVEAARRLGMHGIMFEDAGQLATEIHTLTGWHDLGSTGS